MGVISRTVMKALSIDVNGNGDMRWRRATLRMSTALWPTHNQREERWAGGRHNDGYTHTDTGTHPHTHTYWLLECSHYCHIVTEPAQRQRNILFFMSSSCFHWSPVKQQHLCVSSCLNWAKQHYHKGYLRFIFHLWNWISQPRKEFQSGDTENTLFPYTWGQFGVWSCCSSTTVLTTWPRR